MNPTKQSEIAIIKPPPEEELRRRMHKELRKIQIAHLKAGEKTKEWLHKKDKTDPNPNHKINHHIILIYLLSLS